MEISLQKFLNINVEQHGGSKILIEGGAILLEMWVEAAEAGEFEDEYSPEHIERTKQRIADIRSVTVGGTSENAELN